MSMNGIPTPLEERRHDQRFKEEIDGIFNYNMPTASTAYRKGRIDLRGLFKKVTRRQWRKDLEKKMTPEELATQEPLDRPNGFSSWRCQVCGHDYAASQWGYMWSHLMYRHRVQYTNRWKPGHLPQSCDTQKTIHN